MSSLVPNGLQTSKTCAVKAFVLVGTSPKVQRDRRNTVDSRFDIFTDGNSTDNELNTDGNLFSIPLDITLCLSQTSGGTEKGVSVTYFLALQAFHPAVLTQQVALILMWELKCHLTLQLESLWLVLMQK